MSLLEIKNLHARINDTDILHGIDLTIGRGEIHAIMGPNGSGKSTLSYVLSGRDGYEVTEGDILLDDKSVLELEADERARGQPKAHVEERRVEGCAHTGNGAQGEEIQARQDDFDVDGLSSRDGGRHSHGVGPADHVHGGHDRHGARKSGKERAARSQ